VSDVTRILEAAQQSDPSAADQLLPLSSVLLVQFVIGSLANVARV